MIPVIHKLGVWLGLTTNRVDPQHQTQHIRTVRDSTVTLNNAIDNSTNHYHAQEQRQAPNLFLGIDGDASRNVFKGHVKNNASRPLVVESIKIGEIDNSLNQMVNNLFYLPTLSFDPRVYTEEIGTVPVIMKYKTVEGDHYEYALAGVQEPRHPEVGGFNVHFPSPPEVRYIRNA
jgi:hypothetical protein